MTKRTPLVPVTAPATGTSPAPRARSLGSFLRHILGTRTGRMAITILALLVALPGLLYVVPALAGADAAFVVLSGSMVPLFDPGDVIFVDEVPTDSLAVGDVVTFRIRPGSETLVTHRVLQVLDDGDAIRYRTQGDANEDPDPWVVKQEMVVGTYRFHIPYWGLLMTLIRSRTGYFLFVLIPCGLVILNETVKLYHALDEADRARQAAKHVRAGTGASAATAEGSG